MAALPLIAIVNSVKNAKVCFNDPQLKEGFVETCSGRPVSFSGGYGTVKGICAAVCIDTHCGNT